MNQQISSIIAIDDNENFGRLTPLGRLKSDMSNWEFVRGINHFIGGCQVDKGETNTNPSETDLDDSTPYSGWSSHV